MTGMTLKQLVADGDVVRFEVVGKVSRDSWAQQSDPLAAQFGNEIYERKCLLGLNQALYVDSTGVEWLLTAHQRFNKRGGMLILHSPTPATKQLLKTMRMDLVLHIVDDEQKALQLAQPMEAQHGQ